MSRILSAITALTRRLFSPFGPSARTSESHRAWMSEQMREYSFDRLYASPQDADLNPTGETWEMRLAYRKALKEPAIKGPLLKKVYAVASLTPQVLAEDPKSPADKEAAEWLDWAIQHARGGWPRLLHDCCIHPLLDGFAIGEKVPERVLRGRWKDRWGLHAVKFKETKHLRFHLDAYRNVESVRNFGAAQAGYEFDPRDFLLLTHLPLFENPFGQSDVRAAYRAFNLIEAAIKLRSILLENFSGPFLVFKNSQPGLVDEAKVSLANARSRGYIVITPEDELHVVNLATSAPDQFQTTIDDLRKEAATAIAGAYLQMLESESPQGNSETHKGVSELFEWWLASTVAAAITEQLVPDLHDPHYPATVGRPRVLLGGVDPDASTKAIEKLKAAKDLGLPSSKGQAYELIELEPPADPADTLGGQPPAGPGGMPGMPGGGGGQPGMPGVSSIPSSTPPTTSAPAGLQTQPVASIPPSTSDAAPPSAPDASADDAPPELLAAMLDLAERGDHDGLDALTALADSPDQLAQVMGDQPDARQFGDGGFTGTIRDKVGRVRHYVNGKQVKRADAQIGPDKPHKAAPMSQQAAGEIVRKALLGQAKLPLKQVKDVAEHLKLMTVPQIRKLRAELQAAGHAVGGGKLKMGKVGALVAFAQAHKQAGSGGGQYGHWGAAANPAVSPPVAPPVAPAPPAPAPSPPAAATVAQPADTPAPTDFAAEAKKHRALAVRKTAEADQLAAEAKKQGLGDEDDSDAAKKYRAAAAAVRKEAAVHRQLAEAYEAAGPPLPH